MKRDKEMEQIRCAVVKALDVPDDAVRVSWVTRDEDMVSYPSVMLSRRPNLVALSAKEISDTVEGIIAKVLGGITHERARISALSEDDFAARMRRKRQL